MDRPLSLDNLIRVTGEKVKLQQENDRLRDDNGSLTRENAILKEQTKCCSSNSVRVRSSQ